MASSRSDRPEGTRGWVLFGLGALCVGIGITIIDPDLQRFIGLLLLLAGMKLMLAGFSTSGRRKREESDPQ